MNPKYFAFGVIAMIFLTISVAVIAAENDIDGYRSCSQCGMDRKAYGYSRMMVTFENDTRVGVCSLHCAVIAMNDRKERAATSLWVADRNSRVLINPEEAFWVVGGSKKGVMTQNPKWAFATKEAAQSFVTSYGGTLTNWETALLAARYDANQHHNR
jgi:nitrous oxide reductase accessory protein NosL